MNLKIKRFLKKSSIVSRIGYALREWRNRRNFLAHESSLVEKKVLFATTEGRFNDSCKPIAEMLHEIDKSIDLVWITKNSEYDDDFPTYIRTVQFESSQYYQEMATSCCWIFGYLLPQGSIKKKKQMYIQVWHGDKPFKKIANEASFTSKLYRNRTAGRRFLENELCDYFMTGSDLFIDIWKRSVGYDGKIINTGLPRNDILLRDYSHQAKIIKDKLGLGTDVKILIYAPTFRDHNIDNGNIGTDIDLNRFLYVLEKKYNCEWVCLKRAHGDKKLELDNTKDTNKIIDVTEYKDMTELLMIGDMLVTDYSSCAGDFAYTKKPIILYQDDFDLYTSKDRELIFDMSDTPFYVAHNMAEAELIITALDSELVEKNDEDILKLYKSTQTDHSTNDICKVILEHIKTYFAVQ